MASTGETGQVTGTQDKDYNLIAFTERCLSNALRLEIYAQDAERDGDSELVDLFKRAQQESRQGAEEGKRLLAARLGVAGGRAGRLVGAVRVVTERPGRLLAAASAVTGLVVLRRRRARQAAAAKAAEGLLPRVVALLRAGSATVTPRRRR